MLVPRPSKLRNQVESALVLSPWLLAHVETPISEHPRLSKFLLFSAPPNGNDLLTASLILAIMAGRGFGCRKKPVQAGGRPAAVEG